MVFNGMEFHNTAEIEETKLCYRMHRFPKEVRNNMGEGDRQYGRYVAQTTTGCEIRFVLEGERAIISLTSIDEDGYVQVFRGDFAYYTGYVYSYPVKKGLTTHILLKNDFTLQGFAANHRNGSFSPDVWRIMSDINFTMGFEGIETYGGNLRPPRIDEVPAKTLLCYGTSLTYGACATAHSIAYIQLLGRRIGCNILNKAMGGSCMNEKVVADYFVSLEISFDAVLLENTVNMNGMNEIYEKNSEYLINSLALRFPKMPIYCVTSYPNGSTISGSVAYPCTKKGVTKDTTFKEDEILKSIAANYTNCYIIEGETIMDSAVDLTCDLIHLSDYGHIRVAENLSKIIVF